MILIVPCREHTSLLALTWHFFTLRYLLLISSTSAIFPSGTPEVIADKTNFLFQYYSSEDEKKGVIFGESNQVHFIGKNYGGASISKSRNNYAVALVKPGKPAKVVAANGLFNMKQVNNSDIGGIDNETITESDFNSMRTELTERFGSRKRRRELRSIEANKFNINANESTLLAVQKAMGSAEAEAEKTLGENEEDGVAFSRRAMLPSYDDTTDEVEEIYKFKDIIPKSMSSSLDFNALVAPQETPEELQSIYPKFVLLRRVRLSSLDDDEAKHQGRVLMLLTFLLRLFRLPRRYLSDLANSILCPPQIADYIRTKFLHPTSQELSREYKAKVVCHAVVLALMGSTGFTLEQEALQALATDLKMMVSDLLPYLREVGCSTATKEKAKLSAPLRLPEVGKGGAKKSRRG